MYNCEYCSKNLDYFAFYCFSCNSLQSYKNYDYFSLFNLKTSYKIDLNELETKFIESQKLLHPDLNNDSNPEVSLLINKHNLAVMEANQTLSKADLRVKYILNLRNIDFNKTPNNLELLENILEKRELVSELETLEELKKMEKLVKQDLQIAENNFEQFLQDNNKEELHNSGLEIIYYLKMLEEIKNKKRHLL